MGSRPVPASVMTELKNFPKGSDSEQQRLFKDNFNYKLWRKIRNKADLSDFKFHDIRKTFASVLAQSGISTAVTQRLLEHSWPNLTTKVYTNVDPVFSFCAGAIASCWVCIKTDLQNFCRSIY